MGYICNESTRGIWDILGSEFNVCVPGLDTDNIL